MNKISFKEAMEKGKLIKQNGYHQPQNAHYSSRCPCDLTTDKGAYRDMTFEMPNGALVHFYHQSPIAIEQNGKIRLDNCGYETSTTKERINRYSPFRVFQKDFIWYIDINGEKKEFKNGMVVEKQ